MRPISRFRHLKLVFLRRLMWLPLNFTAEPLKSLTQMWNLVLFLRAHENGLPMLPWGPIQLSLHDLNESSKPIWSIFKGDIWDIKGRWQQSRTVYNCICSCFLPIMWSNFILYHKNFVTSPSLVLVVWHLSTQHLEWHFCSLHHAIYFTPLESITLC